MFLIEYIKYLDSIIVVALDLLVIVILVVGNDVFFVSIDSILWGWL